MSEVIYAFTTDDAEAELGRPLNDEEIYRLRKCVEFSTVSECIGAAMEAVFGDELAARYEEELRS